MLSPLSRSRTILWALAALFSGLLLSSVVLPALMSTMVAKVIAAPAPVEEEQMHGREAGKGTLHNHRAWNGSTLHLDQQIMALFSDRDETVPAGPASDVLLRPPRTA